MFVIPDAGRKSCVYRIVNMTNEKFYVGRTKDIIKRIKTHYYQLKNNKHHSMHLQNSWNKYGEANFRLEIIIFSDDPSYLMEIEQSLIDKYYDKKVLYNVSKLSKDGGDIISYHPKLEDIKKKHSKNGKKRYEEMSDEEKMKLSENMKGENNPMYGKTHDENVRKKISKILKDKYENGEITPHFTGRKHSEETKKVLSEYAKQRVGDKNPFYNKSHSDESKRKLSEANKGKIPPNAIPIVVDGVLYRSHTYASEVLGMSMPAVLYRVNHPSPIFANWYKYEDKKEIMVMDDRLVNLPNIVNSVYEIEGITYLNVNEALEKHNLKRTTFLHRVRSKNFPEWKRLYNVREN